jgi:threonine/homoserine/homoserine lactone efflux protein
MPGPLLADAIQIFLGGISLGFSVAAPPGPVNALAAQQIVSRSWFAGWQILLGATTADAVFFVLTFYGLGRFVSSYDRNVLFILGGGLMLYLAMSLLRKLSKGARRLSETKVRGAAEAADIIRRIPFLLGLSIGLTNPYQLAWWVAIGAGMVADLGGGVVSGFFVGILSWTLIFSAIVKEGTTRYQRLAPLVSYASVIITAAFGVSFLLLGLSRTLP